MDMRLKAIKLFGRRIRSIYIFVLILCLFLGYIFGAFIHPFEIDFKTKFSYDLDLKDFRDVVELIKTNRLSKDKLELGLIGDNQSIESIPNPINEYNYRFIVRNENKCSKSDSKAKRMEPLEEIKLLIVVKSALQNFEQRNAIRKSWGFENRFSDVVIKRVFILGNCLDRTDVYNCQDLIDDEFNVHKDIVQSDFVDSYYNNTIKTMVGFKWSVEYCSSAQFVLFVDDDYYVSIKNLLKYVRNLNISVPFSDSNSMDNRFDGRLYTGYVFPSSPPLRHRTSKWFVSLQEYPYSLYPPYVTAGAFVLSNTSLVDMYFASLYTKHFRFDDIYVSILAKKLSIIPIHNKNFYFWSKDYQKNEYNDVIASHGFKDSTKLLISWNQQKELGFA